MSLPRSLLFSATLASSYHHRRAWTDASTSSTFHNRSIGIKAFAVYLSTQNLRSVTKTETLKLFKITRTENFPFTARGKIPLTDHTRNNVFLRFRKSILHQKSHYSHHLFYGFIACLCTWASSRFDGSSKAGMEIYRRVKWKRFFREAAKKTFKVFSFRKSFFSFLLLFSPSCTRRNFNFGRKMCRSKNVKKERECCKPMMSHFGWQIYSVFDLYKFFFLSPRLTAVYR